LAGELIETAERTGDATVAALAGALSREERFLHRSAELLRSRYRAGRSSLDPRLHHLLDAARLLERERALGPAEVERLCAWLAEHRCWLRDSDEGGAARAALDHRGTWYDVELAAIDAYLGDLAGLLATMRRAHERVGQQFDVDGNQQPEAGTDPLHNLHGWLALAGLAERVGQDLWPALAPAIRRAEHCSPDRSRFAVLVHHAARALPELLDSLAPAERDPYQLPQVFSDREGIRPFWTLGGRRAGG
jgi:hypothetical protein